MEEALVQHSHQQLWYAYKLSLLSTACIIIIINFINLREQLKFSKGILLKQANFLLK